MVPTFGHEPTQTPTPERIRAAHRALWCMFALLGAMMTTFASRMPSVRDLLRVDAAGLALLLLFGSIGSLVALLVVGWASARFGTRALLWWTPIAHLVAFLGVAFGPHLHSTVLFSVGYFATALVFALANVPMNAEAASVERHAGRAIMPQFHAGWSIGMAVGLGLGVLASHYEVPVVVHFMAVAIVVAVARLVIVPIAVIDGRPEPDAVAPGFGGPFATAGAEYRDRRVILIGVIVFAAAMAEMIPSQWLALSVVDDFGKREAVGDLIYWIFVISMFSVRMAGARIIDNLGRVVTLRVSATLAAVGVLIFAFAPVWPLVPLAAVLWGVGAALNFPIGFSAAADDPKRAAARVAAVSSFSTVAGLIVPQVVGRLAEWIELREAMLIVALGSVISFALARAVRSDGKLFTSRRREEKRMEQARMAAAAAEAGPITLDS